MARQSVRRPVSALEAGVKERRSRLMRGKNLRPLIVITLLILVSLAASTIYGAKAAPLTLHSQISIVGNAGFNNTIYTDNGVTSGNGSATNPYIIEGWNIVAPVYKDGIDIEQTNASLVIKNVNIQGGNVGSNGIFLSHATNVVVRDTAISSLNDGISIFLSNATVENSLISSNGEYGISILDGENVNLFNNTITLGLGDGIHGNNYCVNCLLNVTGNRITSNLSGIILQSMNNSFIFENTVSANQNDGIGVYRSTYVVFVLNNVTNNGVGANLVSSTNNLVHHNNFVTNHLQAFDNKTGQNMWDVGYASGGNYWSDYTGVDNCSGPRQDICPRPDGIGDKPYTFASARDNYPLENFFVQSVVHDVAVSSITPSATSVNQTGSISIRVTVANEGATVENFTLTLYYDRIVIGAQIIQALAPAMSEAIFFDWNTTGVALGPHYLKAAESTVWGEIDVADNTLVAGPILVKTPITTTPPPSKTPTQTSPSTDIYAETGFAGLLLLFLLVIVAYRRRGRTR
jgi:hypothetical protein